MTKHPWVHRLTDTDLISKTAMCANCGRVRVKVHKQKNGKVKAYCRNGVMLVIAPMIIQIIWKLFALTAIGWKH